MPTLKLYMDKQASKKKLCESVRLAMPGDGRSEAIASAIANRAKFYEDLLSFHKQGLEEYEIRGDGYNGVGECILGVLEKGHSLNVARTLVAMDANKTNPVDVRNVGSTLPCGLRCACWVGGYTGQANGYRLPRL
ncbi:MAG TPA: hypothetical protein VFH95_00760 [Candidatus Kapabacteria bacterium]|nr:hypothetical protein [Candidatus Kapabacteria bacterium]